MSGGYPPGCTQADVDRAIEYEHDEDASCPHCGKRLPEPVNECPRCGVEIIEPD